MEIHSRSARTTVVLRYGLERHSVWIVSLSRVCASQPAIHEGRVHAGDLGSVAGSGSDQV